MTEPLTSVSAVVLGYGPEPWLSDCVEALLASVGVELDVVLVDNGCLDSAAMSRLADEERVRVLRPATNLGYAGGCNLGAAAATGDVIAFINSDAVVEPTALGALAAAVADPRVGLATASVRLADDPERINAAGNPFHILGLVWAGHYGESALEHLTPGPVATVSGAAFAVRRETWVALDGFPEPWFAYNEDAELSLRCWQRDWMVVFTPAAVVRHHYEFSRNARKSYLVERNRLLNLLTLYQARTLLALLPPLVGFEVAMLALAVRQGWWREKLRGYAWIVGHAGWVLRRRRRVQAARVRCDRDLAGLWTARLEPANVALPPGLPIVNAVIGAWWWAAQRAL